MRSASLQTPRASLTKKALGAGAQRAVWLAATARGAERFVVGGAVLAVGLGPTATRVVAAAAVTAVMMGLRSLAAVHSDLRVRRDIYLAVADSLAEADAMQAVPLPGGDAEGALSEAVYAGTRVLGSVVPFLIGDVVAGAVFGVVTMCLLDWRIAVLAAAVLVSVSLGSVLASRTVVRAQSRHVDALLSVHEGLAELLERREEIAATGAAREVRSDLESRLTEWQRRALAARLTASVGARVPAAMGALLLAAAVATSPPLLALVKSTDAVSLLALVVLAPIVLEVARGALELRRAGPDLTVLERLLALPPLEIGGGEAVSAPPTEIVARGVSFAYGTGAVIEDVSCEWRRGSVLVFAGPNGAGKSTMLRLLLGLARPKGGSLSVDGTDMFDIDLVALRRHVAYVPQRPALSKRRSVRDVLSKVDGGDAGSIAALVQLGFAEDTPASFLDRPMATLSAGQAQRVALARAFASPLPLLVLDEPDANLDERSVECLAARLRELRGERAIAVAAHHPKLLACADHHVVLGAAR